MRFGFHQGCYGYYDRERLECVARAYREAGIPLDPGARRVRRAAAIRGAVDRGQRVELDFLRITIPQVLNLGLSGVSISGSDVGGFATGPVPDGTTAPSVVRDGQVVGGITETELFVRWMQAGSFLPWFRNHYLGYDKNIRRSTPTATR